MKRSGYGKVRGLRPLGELEFEIMKVLWERGEATGREVWTAVKASRKAALTTVLTVIERLSNKGLVEKVRTGGPFVYRPLLTGEEFTRKASAGMLRDYMEVSSASLIASFLDALSETDPEGMERLAELIRKKKKERDRDV
ncbi:MAG TPA: BlaI/MecI/CopY family transcriptional regulator [Deltaproteobacteria bacterium]|nr:BlaI/MecI/CopY family transcriptional regulator [Deltaproteobacteria bacterium]